MDGGIRMVTEFGYFFWKNYWGIGLLNEELRKMSLCMQRNGLVDEKSRISVGNHLRNDGTERRSEIGPFEELFVIRMNEQQTTSVPRASYAFLFQVVQVFFSIFPYYSLGVVGYV